MNPNHTKAILSPFALALTRNTYRALISLAFRSFAAHIFLLGEGEWEGRAGQVFGAICTRRRGGSVGSVTIHTSGFSWPSKERRGSLNQPG